MVSWVYTGAIKINFAHNLAFEIHDLLRSLARLLVDDPDANPQQPDVVAMANTREVACHARGLVVTTSEALRTATVGSFTASGRGQDGSENRS